MAKSGVTLWKALGAIPVLFLVPLLTSALPQVAKGADEFVYLRSAIDSYNRNPHWCPAGDEEPMLDFKSYCKQYYISPDDPNNPCLQNNRNACHQLAEGGNQCLKEMNEKNQVIIQFNEIVRRCKQAADQDKSSSSRPSVGKDHPGSETGNSNLASRLAAQKAKNATATETKQRLSQRFMADAQAENDRYQAQQRAAQQAAEQEREAVLQEQEQEEQQKEEQAAKDRGMAKCNAEYQRGKASCAGLPMRNYFVDGHWVYPEGITCLRNQSVRYELCTATLEGASDARIAELRSLLSNDGGNRASAPSNNTEDACTALKNCDAGCGPPSDATASCWNACVLRYGRC